MNLTANQIILKFGEDEEHCFKFSEDFTKVQLWNNFFEGFFPFNLIERKDGTILDRVDIVEIIKEKIKSN